MIAFAVDIGGTNTDGVFLKNDEVIGATVKVTTKQSAEESIDATLDAQDESELNFA